MGYFPSGELTRQSSPRGRCTNLPTQPKFAGPADDYESFFAFFFFLAAAAFFFFAAAAFFFLA
jgi:hypothetical protein